MTEAVSDASVASPRIGAAISESSQPLLTLLQAAARQRLKDCENIEIRRGELETLPVDDDALDAATICLVLHHVPDPAAVVLVFSSQGKPEQRTLRCSKFL